MTLEELDILERRVANYADRFVLAIQEGRKTDAEFIKAGMVEAVCIWRAFRAPDEARPARVIAGPWS